MEKAGYIHDEYDADGDGDADINWVPSVGWEFDHNDIPAGDNVSLWRTITVHATADLAGPVTLTFSHEVWEDDTYCPEHDIGRVTVSISADGGGNPDPQVDPSVTVSPTSLTVREDTAGQAYRVRLDSQPSGTVAVSVSGYANTDVRVNPDTLTFTDSTYNDWQEVRVTVVHDVDAEDDPPVTLTHTANGGGYNGVTVDDVTVTIDDDDTASNRFTLAVNPTEVSEGVGSSGRAVTVTATLNHAPRTTDTEVTVSVDPGTASSNDFEPVDDFTLRIDAGQMIGTADFQLKPVDDDVDESDETVRVSGSASGLTMNSPAPTVTILDNDTGAFLVSPADI